MQIERASYEILANGQKVDLFELSNNSGMIVEISNFGGAVVSLIVPDAKEQQTDVVLGFDSLMDYQENSPYLGVIVGRYANRISNGTFTIEDQKYQLTQNFGEHHLHGGAEGFSKKIWAAEQVSSENAVGLKLFYISEDGEEGYPGNFSVTTTYWLTEENELKIEYHGSTDKSTVVNLTNHSYFNLSGPNNGNILNHHLKIHADEFTPLGDSQGIPSGAVDTVEGTPLDFRKFTRIGDKIDAAHEQIQLGEGYDHNYVLNGTDDELMLAAEVFDPVSGRGMEVHTSEPGVQFYTANNLGKGLIGKDGVEYSKRIALCLETQHFPDSPNNPNFPSTLLNPGGEFSSTTVYKFLPEKK